jgi:hypothetical protein
LNGIHEKNFFTVLFFTKLTVVLLSNKLLNCQTVFLIEGKWEEMAFFFVVPNIWSISAN